MRRCKLAQSTIEKVLQYEVPERARITHTGRPSLLTVETLKRRLK